MTKLLDPMPLTARLLARAACGALRKSVPQGHMLDGLARWGVQFIAEYDSGRIGQQQARELIRQSRQTLVSAKASLYPSQQVMAHSALDALSSVVLTDAQLPEAA